MENENIRGALEAVARAAGVDRDAVRLTVQILRGEIDWTVEIRGRISARRRAWCAWGPGGASPALACALAVEQVRRLAGTPEAVRP